LDIPNVVGASLVTTLYKVLQEARRQRQRERDLYERLMMEEEHSQKRQSRRNEVDEDNEDDDDVYSEGYNDADHNDTNAAAANMVVSGDNDEDNSQKTSDNRLSSSTSESWSGMCNLCHQLLCLIASELRNSIALFSVKDMRNLLEAYEDIDLDGDDGDNDGDGGIQSLVDRIEIELNERSLSSINGIYTRKDNDLFSKEMRMANEAAHVVEIGVCHHLINTLRRRNAGERKKQ